MILTPEALDTYDKCERRYAFSRRYDPLTITPLGLLYAALEWALISGDPEQAAKDECLRIAREKEIQSEHLNGFAVVRHVGLLAGIIALALHKKFGRMRRLDPVPFGENQWQSNLFAVRARTYRFVLTSHWDDDTLRAYAHSWGTVGELAALEAPLNLVAIVIGASRNGRRHSAWTKGLLHPVNGSLRFRKRQKGDFSDGWQEVWRENRMDIPTEKWLAQMEADGVMESLIVSREIAYRAEDARMQSARREMFQIIGQMGEAREDAPMRRSACDLWGGCPFQPCCFSAKAITPADLQNLYRDTLPAEPGARK